MSHEGGVGSTEPPESGAPALPAREREGVRVEATGETVGEAKWAALRELEQLVPGLDRETVAFDVVSEGERGLLGVGYSPARVVATVPEGSAAAPSTAVADARELVDRIASAIGADVSVSATERDETVTVTCSGADLGLLIGKHGQTIDAIQYLANAVVRAEGGTHEVVVDAAGYRARRTATLEAAAIRSARLAAASGNPVELDPMTAVERKIVHEALKDDPEVETMSEGSEPNRFVVVIPRATPTV
jgi:spoIIIJ-associated protein